MRAFFLLLSACFAGQLLAARPNILHIHADDHRADGLGALGAPGLLTPHLDTLVARGMTFTRAYTQGSMIGAVCTPSRTMMLTGRSWQRIPGAKSARPGANDPQTFLPSVLAAAGYRTWHMGKGGNAFTEGLKTFQTSILDDGKKEGDPATDRAHASARLADRTIGFLKEHAARKDAAPFYAYLAPPVPHDRARPNRVSTRCMTPPASHSRRPSCRNTLGTTGRWRCETNASLRGHARKKTPGNRPPTTTPA